MQHAPRGRLYRFWCERLEPRTLLSAAALRPPAVPLVTSDPYLSIWSEADHLTDSSTRHWTGAEQALVSLIRVDGSAYRLMGNDPAGIPAFAQSSVQVLPTRSIYEFDNAHVDVTLTFMTPALPDNLDVLSRPVGYITWDVRSVDGLNHSVSIYDSTSSELAVNTTDQNVVWQRQTMGPVTALQVGTQAQTYLQPAGDGVRIDWGYAYAAAPTVGSMSAIGADSALLSQFVSTGTLPSPDDPRMPRPVSDNQPVMAFAFNLGSVGAQPISRHVMIAYDEVYSINYFGDKLQPYWRRNGATPADLLPQAEADYPSLVQQCAAFDQELMADLTVEGGPQYAQIGALAYRQALAGCGLAADANKQPLLFTKENTSNGDIATVDVMFPMSPELILLSPSLAKAVLAPILTYSASSHWSFPNAPHDLGTYPNAFGRDDGGEAMPVEESGNMLIMLDAIAQQEGSAEFAAQWWPQVTQWAQYLAQNGFDSGQLYTDDFLGPLPHNANLSVKAIIGLAAFGDLARLHGDPQDAITYTNLARTDAQNWIQMDSDGNHYRLAFDQPGTWSQKYNLVWDQILGFNLFPVTVRQAEVAYYKTQLRSFGLPLDSRGSVTKTDWTVWSATLATNPADFQTLIMPLYNYLDQTGARVPMSDLYTSTDVNSDGLHARPVVGGVFIKMLADRAMWNKWASRDQAQVGNWAKLPQIVEVVPSSKNQPVTWRYTTQTPASNWNQVGFNDSAWQQGPAGFGTAGTPGAVVRTTWNTSDIWLRRTFTMPAGDFPNLQFYVYHDEGIEIYVNGVLGASATGYVTSYQLLDISPAARALLTPGTAITLAVHCHQTVGGQGVDVGLANITGRFADFSYLLTLAQHYNQPGTFDTGDLNADGTVNFADLLLLAQHYNQPIPFAATVAVAAAPALEDQLRLMAKRRARVAVG